ncbi:hypothetical protein WMF39_06540 [Sorangium sp. So ce1504]|uniref:hypothetical protein n=1 Tax=Sorangium sp. So ce1504 TaxID=3133337 RepID=UPI003F61E46C
MLLAGRFEGEMELDGVSVVSAGGADAFVASLGAAGEPIWIEGFGDTGHDEASDVTVDSAQRTVVTGSFEGTVDFGGGPLVSAGGADAFVAQLDAAGLHRYSFRLGDEGEQAGRSLSAGPSGTVALGGVFQGSIALGARVLTSAGGTELFWAKLDADGNPLLGGRAGDGGDQHHVAVASAASGAITLAGSYQGEIAFGSEVLMGAGETAYTAELGDSGSFESTWHYDAMGAQHGHDITVDRSGNVFALGAFEKKAQIGGDVPIVKSSGGSNRLLVKLDPSGEPVWHKVLADHGIYLGSNAAIAVDALGNVFLTGNRSEDNMVLVKLDAAGTWRWELSFASPHDITALDVLADPAGDIVLLGSTEATELDFGGGPFWVGGTVGSASHFVLKMTGDHELLWARGVDDDTPSRDARVGVDAAGNVVVTWIEVIREPVLIEPDFDYGDSDLVVTKLDPAGNELWNWSVGAGPEDYGYIRPQLAAVDDVGNVFIHAGVIGRCDFGGGPVSDTHVLVKLDADGQLLWDTSLPSEWLTAMAPVGDGGLLLAGWEWGMGDVLRVVELDGVGSERWSKGDMEYVVGEFERPMINAMAWDGAGSIVMTGEFAHKLDLGGSALYGTGEETMFVAKLAR